MYIAFCLLSEYYEVNIMRTQDTNFSDTIEIPETEIKISEQFSNLFKQIGCQMTDTPKQMGIRKILKEEQNKFGMLDMLNLLPDDRLGEFISGMEAAQKEGKKTPLAKLYMHFGHNEMGLPFGVHGFIIPPNCKTPPHSHHGDIRHPMDGTEDTCLSMVLGSSPVVQTLFANLNNSSSFAHAFSSSIISKDSPISVISSDNTGLGIGDTHQLVSPKGSRYLDQTILALKDYRQSRIRGNEPSMETAQILDENITCTFQSYVGLDEHERRSSVRGVFHSSVATPKDLRIIARDILSGEKVWPIELYLLEASMRVLDSATSERVVTCRETDPRNVQ